MTKKFGHVEKYKSAIDCVLCYTYIAGGEDYTIHIHMYYGLLAFSLASNMCIGVKFMYHYQLFVKILFDDLTYVIEFYKENHNLKSRIIYKKGLFDSLYAMLK